jgi:hypothetical protein
MATTSSVRASVGSADDGARTVDAAVAAIPIDVWIHIFQYFDRLSTVVRVWVAFGLRRRIDKHHPLWTVLLRHYFALHNKDMDKMLGYMSIPTITSIGLDLYGRLNAHMRCSRSGCFQYFQHIDNYENACRYHPGKLNNVGKLSCCRVTAFSAPGCKLGWHDASFFELVHRPREDKGSQKSQKDSSLPQIVTSASSNKKATTVSSTSELQLQPTSFCTVFPPI